MKTVAQKVVAQLLEGDPAAGLVDVLIDVITLTNLENTLEVIQENQLNAPYDTGIDAEENGLDLAALRRVIAMFKV